MDKYADFGEIFLKSIEDLSSISGYADLIR